MLRVALDVPLARLFDYLPPVSGGMPRPGCRVVVPFAGRRLVGVVVTIAADSELPVERLKHALTCLDDAPLLDQEILRLAEFCAGYYRHPQGGVLLGGIPPRLREPRPFRAARAGTFAVSLAGRAAAHALPARAALQRRLLAALEQAGGVSAAQVRALSASAPRLLAEFVRRGWAVEVPAASPPGAADDTVPQSALNPAQAAAVAEITAGLANHAVWLLHGVTGSGKTEVYLRLIGEVLARGRQALVLVPEINLTPQLEGIFRRRFPGMALAALHSNLADDARARHWLAAAAGDARIVLGTRLAVFTPLPDLGLLIVDEEQDASFKQQEGLRYNARDLAILRASWRGVPVLLGSATPALETFRKAQTGRYRLLRLPERAVAGALLPAVRCVRPAARPRAGLALEIEAALALRLERGEQSLVFVNRRGFAPVLACHACGWLSGCPRCSVRLVLHAPHARLRCHHCGHEEPAPPACPDCGNVDLRPVGHGTQRIEAMLAARFPAARIHRVDRDTTARRGAMYRLHALASAGEVDILVGTQILAKGHDFPNITLVAVIDADGALTAADFRAEERLLAQLVQVAGRAGRGDKPGEVLIETRYPGHPVYAAATRHDFERFAAAQLRLRRQAELPPFSHQAILRADAEEPGAVETFVHRAAELGRPLAVQPVTLFDPVPAPIARLAGRSRWQLLAQSPGRRVLTGFLDAWLPLLHEAGERRVRWALDVDPVEV